MFAFLFVSTFALAQGIIDRLDVDNIRLDGNTISTRNTNGDLTLDMSGTGSVILTDLTATTVPYLDANKKIKSSAVTPTELNLLSGVLAIGNVVGPASATDNAVTLFDSTTGKLLKNSSVTVSGSAITGSLTGNASTATALASNPSDCASDTYATTIAASGNLTCATVTNAGLAGSIAASKLVGTDIATVGTLTAGVWNATTIAIANGGTGQATKTAAFDALSPLSSIGDVLYHDGTNNVRLAGNTTGTRKFLSGTGLGGFALPPTWQQVAYSDLTGSPPAAGTNDQREYITNGRAETDTTGWSTYADAAAATPADGTGGSPNVTFSRTTTGSEIIRETASFKLAKSAANRQGEGVSYDFTVDPQDYANGRAVPVSFEYKTTANFASSDIVCSVRDTDAGAALTLLDSSNLAGALPASTGGTRFTGRFYPTSTTSDSYRLICHIATTNATAYDFIWDSVHAGNSPVVPGAIITDWKSYTPTGSWVSNTTYTGFWRRVGGEAQVRAKLTTSGAPTNTQLTISVPSECTIDTTKILSSTLGFGPIFGSLIALDSGAAGYTGVVVYASTTTVYAYLHGAAATTTNYVNFSSTAPFTWASGDWVDFEFSVPCANWAASASLSTTEALFQAGTFRGTASQTVNNTTPTITLTSSWDPLGSYSSTTFTARRNGKYKLGGFVRSGSVIWTAGNAIEVYYVKNGGGNTVIGRTNVPAYTGNAQAMISESVSLSAGDTLVFKAYSDVSNTAEINITVDLIPDFSAFSVYGNFEILTTTSSVKTPTANGNYSSVTGNSLTLTTGTWRLFGKLLATSSGGSPSYSSVFVGWYAANGADTSSVPANLATVTGLTLLTGEGTTSSALNGVSGTSSAADIYPSTQPVVVRCATSTCVVYLVPFANMTTPANARFTTYANAERLQ